MAGKRQPVEVVQANGRKHLTKAEIETRKTVEVKAPCPKTVKPPKYLSDTLKKKFRAIAKRLIELGIFSDLDADCLARYLLAEQDYLHISQQLQEAIATKDIGTMETLSKIQTRYFTQCSRSASDLGLTISKRCQLIVPRPPDDPAANDPLAKLLQLQPKKSS